MYVYDSGYNVTGAPPSLLGGYAYFFMTFLGVYTAVDQQDILFATISTFLNLLL